MPKDAPSFRCYASARRTAGVRGRGLMSLRFKPPPALGSRSLVVHVPADALPAASRYEGVISPGAT